jgi:hypothetical protein
MAFNAFIRSIDDLAGEAAMLDSEVFPVVEHQPPHRLR